MKKSITTILHGLAVIVSIAIALSGCKKEPAAIPVQSVSVEPATLNIAKGESHQLTATVLPENATNKTVSWSTSDASVATVSDGLVTAVAPGKASITVKTNDGAKTAVCDVTVSIFVSGIVVNPTALAITEGETGVITATIIPENASNKNLIWTTSDPTVATVNEGTVTGVAPGTALITVKTIDGEKTASCAVTVNTKVYAVTGVKVEPESLSLVEGETGTVTAIVEPENATNKSVIWYTSNPDVVTVSQGTVTAVAAGTANVTVRTSDGDFSAVCSVTVTEKALPVTGVTVSPELLTVIVGDKGTVTATVLPEKAGNKNVTWTSGNESVATVADGVAVLIRVAFGDDGEPAVAVHGGGYDVVLKRAIEHDGEGVGDYKPAPAAVIGHNVARGGDERGVVEAGQYALKLRAGVIHYHKRLVREVLTLHVRMLQLQTAVEEAVLDSDLHARVLLIRSQDTADTHRISLLAGDPYLT